MRTDAGDRPSQPHSTRRSITGSDSSPLSSSSPTRSANAASLPAANNSAFARAALAGPAALTTSRANPAADTDSERGA